MTICIFSPWRRKLIVSFDLFPLIWPCIHSNTWHSSWWAVIYSEAELTASVRLKQQTVCGTDLQLRKAKLTFNMLFNFKLLCSYFSFIYCIPHHPCHDFPALWLPASPPYYCVWQLLYYYCMPVFHYVHRQSLCSGLEPDLYNKINEGITNSIQNWIINKWDSAWPKRNGGIFTTNRFLQMIKNYYNTFKEYCPRFFTKPKLQLR